LARIGQFPNFLRFFKAKSAFLSGRRDVIVGDITSRIPAERFQVAVTSSSVTSHRAYPQNDSGVARNLQAKFGADRCSRWRANSEHTDRHKHSAL
jgi:hypothetical protein